MRFLDFNKNGSNMGPIGQMGLKIYNLMRDLPLYLQFKFENDPLRTHKTFAIKNIFYAHANTHTTYTSPEWQKYPRRLKSTDLKTWLSKFIKSIIQ